jgi:5-formyltetrahydrofolate cyclo-ligase
MSYMAFGAEPDLGAFHTAIFAADSRLIVPRVSGRIIEPVEYRPGTELVVSRFGIAEPVGEPIDPLTIDVVLVPAVCFDRRGHRIGYGAGYYDRFLPLTRTDCRRIGVAFANQLVDRVPDEPHDQPVGMLITDEGAILVGDS